MITYLGTMSQVGARVKRHGTIEPLGVTLRALAEEPSWSTNILIISVSTRRHRHDPQAFYCQRPTDVPILMSNNDPTTIFAAHRYEPLGGGLNELLPRLPTADTVARALRGVSSFFDQTRETVFEGVDIFDIYQLGRLCEIGGGIYGLPSGLMLRVHRPNRFGQVITFDPSTPRHLELDARMHLFMRMNAESTHWPPDID